MKKDFFEQLKEKIKKFQNNNSKEMHTGYNTSQNNHKNSILINNGQLENGYIRLTTDGQQVVTKEIIIQEVIEEIKNFVNMNKQVISHCKITDDEWRIFLEISYNYFNKYQLISGFSSLMMSGIQYVMFNGFVNEQKEISLQTMLENFEIPMLPWGVANGMIEEIRKNVYMTTRKDNIVDFTEYRKVSKK